MFISRAVLVLLASAAWTPVLAQQPAAPPPAAAPQAGDDAATDEALLDEDYDDAVEVEEVVVTGARA